MKMKKAAEISYTQVGDYKVPNIVLTDTTQYSIGRYGRMRQRYLETQHPFLYSQMILSEKLFPHLAKIDQCCMMLLKNTEVIRPYSFSLPVTYIHYIDSCTEDCEIQRWAGLHQIHWNSACIDVAACARRSA